MPQPRLEAARQHREDIFARFENAAGIPRLGRPTRLPDFKDLKWLARSRDKRAIPLLKWVLTNLPDFETKERAAKALKQGFGQDPATPLKLATQADDTGDLTNFSSNIRALARLEGMKARRHFEKLVHSGKTDYTGDTKDALKARVRMHTYRAFRDQAIPGSWAFLRQGLSDPDDFVRSEAVVALADNPHPAILRELATVTDNDGQPFNNRYQLVVDAWRALQANPRFKHHRAVKQLSALLGDFVKPDGQLRLDASSFTPLEPLTLDVIAGKSIPPHVKTRLAFIATHAPRKPDGMLAWSAPAGRAVFKAALNPTSRQIFENPNALRLLAKQAHSPHAK